MDLLPALDLRHGRAVRLRQGDASRETVYGGDPFAILAAFAQAGADRVHLVDLDAALGEAPQRELVERLIDRLARAGGAPAIQLGGGLRDGAAVRWALAAGCARAVVGSLLARSPEGFRELALELPGRLVPALELAGGEVRIAGWREGAGRGLGELCGGLRGLPCPAVLVTDVERDGMLAGPNLDLARRVARLSALPALLSGGVRSLADIEAARRLPEIAGVVVGRALYEGTLDLAAALRACAGEGPGASNQTGQGPSASNQTGQGPGASDKTAGQGLGASKAAAAGNLPGTQCPSGLARRVIPCLDVADGRVVKGVRFAGLRDQGDPAEAALRYAEQGADEIVFLDIGAAPERRDTDLGWVQRTAERVFVPLTVGGGVRSAGDASRLLGAGADKIAVNTAAVARPELLEELARRFGSQCVVLSVDARRRPAPAEGWEVVVEGGRRPTGRDALEWIAAAVERGAGEILLTSIDRDGTRGGYDLELISAAARTVPVPVIASGGAGTPDHLAAALAAGAAAVLAASIFHQGTFTVGEVKSALAAAGFPIRQEAAG
jgi:cyclase